MSRKLGGVTAWEVDRIKGHHEAIVSLDTFNRNQKRLNDKPVSFVRQDVREDFELRGLVNCSCCKNKLTAAFSKSKTGKKHPYYKCATKGCDYYGKSIRKAQLDDDFNVLVADIKPCTEIVELAEAIFDDVWQSAANDQEKSKNKAINEHKTLEAKLEVITDKIATASNDTVVRQYEKIIEKLGVEIEELERKINDDYDYSIPYRTSREQVFQILLNPEYAWKNYDVYQKQRFFNFIFEANLEYDRNNGYRTPLTTLPLRIFEELSTNESGEVEVGRMRPHLQGRHLKSHGASTTRKSGAYALALHDCKERIALYSQCSGECFFLVF